MAVDNEKRLFHTAEIAAVTHGVVLSRIPSASIGDNWVTGICVDSRNVEQNSLFIALSGERTDGHNFLIQAVKAGANCLLIQKEKKDLYASLRLHEYDVTVIAVEDTLTALQDLAAQWVSRYPGLVRLAITGSSGKTTTKEMLGSILSQLGPTVKNPGNYNSDIGLPLSVFQIDASHEYGVFEMGINHFGEMENMLRVFTPDISLMTNIGTAHIGMFGSTEAIAREKSRIFHQELHKGYIYEGNIWKSYIERIRGVDLKTFGIDVTPGFEGAQSLGLDGWDIIYEGRRIHLQHLGIHNLLDALAAIHVARELGATSEHIRAGLEELTPMKGRSRVINGQVTVIEDSYNSNVESAGRILDYVEQLPWNGRKNVVLGSMKELGFASQSAHRIIGEKVSQLNPQGTFLYGKEMEAAYDLLKRENYSHKLFYTDSFEELEEQVTSYVSKGDLVLLKGSRAMAMERLVQPLSMVS